MNTVELWDRLAAAGLVQGDPPESEEVRSPWYVRTMLGIAGWIGALFLFAFIGAAFAFVTKSAIAALCVGAALCAATRLMFSARRGNDFVGQFALATSLAGQILVLFGLFELFKSAHAVAALAGAAFEIALIALLPHYVHRVWSTIAAALLAAWALAQLGQPFVIGGVVAAAFAIVWLNESRWARHASLWEPVGVGLAVVLVWWNVSLLWSEMAWLWSTRLERAPSLWWLHLGRLLTAGVFVYAVVRLLRREEVPPGSRAGVVAIAGSVLLMIATWFAPGVAAALLVMLLGFANGSRFLLGLGLIALIGYLSHYYYQLDMTLLMKAGVLAITGAVLLAARLALLRLFPLHEQEIGHAEETDHA